MSRLVWTPKVSLSKNIYTSNVKMLHVLVPLPHSPSQWSPFSKKSPK